LILDILMWKMKIVLIENFSFLTTLKLLVMLTWANH